MRSHLQLGRIFGISIGLHYSWLVIAAMIAFSLAGHFRMMYPDWGQEVVWASALLTAILFFAALVAHEMAHALVARAQGLSVRAITLFALGGVAQIEGEPRDAKSEFRMAIVGPLASVLIGAGCLTAATAFGWVLWSDPSEPIEAVLVWLGYINISLAVFNMVPGYPLDGGRVLRAIAWWITGDASRSLRIASRSGRLVGVLMMAGAVLRFVAGAGPGRLWIGLFGYFLFRTAGASYDQLRITDMLRGVRVGDLMMRDTPRVDAWTNLEAFAQETLPRGTRFCYMVTNNGQPAGLISQREIRMVPQPQWRYKTVADVMRPLDELETIAPDAPVTDALEAMGRDDISQLPVAANGRIEGIISRAIVVGFLEAHGGLRP